jgi:RimJ/RimL family protein N-acetyltransferase
MAHLLGAAHLGGLVRVARFPDLVVATPRLHIRALIADDAPEIERIFADRLTRRWLPLPAGCGPIDGLAWCTVLANQRRASGDGDHEAGGRREKQPVVGCVWTKGTDWVGRCTEVSFAVSGPARGFGVAGEALDAVAVALILEHGLQRVELRLVPGNTASRRVAEKAGFIYEGLLRNAGHVHSGRVDLEMWSLVAADLR